MPADTEITLRGMAELQRALSRADRESRLFVRDEFKGIAEPIRREAESLAHSEITRIGRNWFKMRTGVTRKVVYVAPRQRGVKTKGRASLRRPNLAGLLMDRAMEPALEHHEAEVEHAVERGLDRIADHFDRGG